jgi:photosystem II stability/assembly factor-like uncharacterized protein
MNLRAPGAGLALAAALAVSLAHAAGFQDPLDMPAAKTGIAAQGLLNALARAGDRLVAVGQRGHVVVSGDAGKTWSQVAVPISSDLVAVHFPTATQGWAVGHDGVVLASGDGGQSWTKQLDGRSAGQLMAKHYAAAEPRLAEEAKRYAEQGPDKPFLDVWFESGNTGYVVGAFNLIFRTDDGGKTWQPWFDRTDNPKALHLYAIRAVGEDLFIVGEQGLVLKLDRKAGRFNALPTPYKGTFFGITGQAGAVLAYGLRGNVFRSTDGGANWAKVETALQLSLTGSAVTEDGRILLVSQAGNVLASSDGGASFKPLALERSVPSSALLPAGNTAMVIAGARGVHLLSVK